MDGVSGIVPGSTTPAPNGFSDLNSEDFVKIIFTELTNQDPLQPSDSKALLEQLSSLRSIQSDMDLSKRLETLVTQNQLSSATGLIGRLVSGVTDRNERIADFVVSVSRTADGAYLNLRAGSRMALDNVDEVIDERILDKGAGS